MGKASQLSDETLYKMEGHDSFIPRHIGLSEADGEHIRSLMGYSSEDAFIKEIVPQQILIEGELALDPPMSEQDMLTRMRAMGKKNKIVKSFIGQGYYNNHTPAVILRNVLENPAWYTAYTPYQAEISQGRLEASLNFQTMVADLTGMDISNASLLDEATAAAEAMTLGLRVTKTNSRKIFLDQNIFAQTKAVVAGRAELVDVEIIEGEVLEEKADFSDFFAVMVQYPAANGEVQDYKKLAVTLNQKGVLLIVATDILSLCLLTPPGEWGADVVVGAAQRFGLPMSCGGPHAAFMAVKEKFQRHMPGRIIGVSLDSKGRKAYRMALQTREQHIRREKATSNVCTAQALLANMAGFFAVYHGPEGLKRIATRTHLLTSILAAGLEEAGLQRSNRYGFDTIHISAGKQAKQFLKDALEQGYNLFDAGKGVIGISLDQTAKRKDVEKLLAVFAPRKKFDIEEMAENVESLLPEAFLRQDDILTHSVFHSYRSETKMLRYLRSLSDKDLALDRAMIPLGSCTMKLNATSEMIPITWPHFGRIHPFAPGNQLQGYQTLIESLEKMLCEITGFDAVSFQPNSGAQGEYAGLRAIRHYLESRGETERDICLIPVSAHGTNPASAVMAGLRPVIVACDEKGNIDLADLEKKIATHGSRLAALMVTYPSTHGVFEEKIVDICQMIHEAGGQVYMDGANLNAQLGLCKPALIGADVSHMNLHKTFCIPHGGGGPGVGPIGVKAHLKPFLPGHIYGEGKKEDAVSAAPWGSAGILPISWAYIAMMGAVGMKKTSVNSILVANYVSWRLKEHYQTLYSGERGHVAHECIIDIRPVEKISGIGAEDIAKRLMDYGFHAPTMSFPVANTLMIEPTESESLAEIDRLCDALIMIREEIREIEAGKADKTDNVLKNAPHTAEDIAGEWVHPYSREKAVFPIPSLCQIKYWPPVSRIDNAYGDRHLFCVCPPVEELLEAAE